MFNVHLGTGFSERRYQAVQLLSEDVLNQSDLSGPRLILGDFNEWMRGPTSKMLGERFRSLRPQHVAGLTRTFPGMLPILTLDNCYYEPPLELQHTELWRSREALVASDHLPLIATFELAAR